MGVAVVVLDDQAVALDPPARELLGEDPRLDRVPDILLDGPARQEGERARPLLRRL